MKRWTIYALCAALLIGTVGCAPVEIMDSRGKNEPIRIVGTVQTPSPVPASSEPVSTATPEPLTVTVTTAPTATLKPLETAIPTATPSPKPTPTATPTALPTATPSPDLEDVERFLAIATSLLDKPYQLGGKTEDGFDPGGFVYYCLNKTGVKVAHKASRGYAQEEKWTKIASMDDLEPGDLCFFQTGTNENVNCVCIYLGDGKMIYPSSSKGAVITTKIHSTYWEEAFVFARRVF